MIVMRMNTGDTELALAAAGGDAKAFSLLLERSYDRLFGLCFRLTGSRFEAEDLCQDICAALPAKLMRFEGGSSFSTWLYRVAVNASHDRRRRAATRSKAAQGWGDWEVNRTEANKEQAEAQNWLMQAIGSLPDDLRDTVALVMDDMNHRDVGEVLGVSEGTISWRMSEVKKRLKEIKEREQ
ncbi:RNA polymerase sigma factor [Planktotalea sp.]|uniref:RNA polymerase sigma factor n=1 Tax=Planktotalea sp. TaxID=2029877 RepID=UPI003296DA68